MTPGSISAGAADPTECPPPVVLMSPSLGAQGSVWPLGPPALSADGADKPASAPHGLSRVPLAPRRRGREAGRTGPSAQRAACPRCWSSLAGGPTPNFRGQDPHPLPLSPKWSYDLQGSPGHRGPLHWPRHRPHPVCACAARSCSLPPQVSWDNVLGVASLLSLGHALCLPSLDRVVSGLPCLPETPPDKPTAGLARECTCPPARPPASAVPPALPVGRTAEGQPGWALRVSRPS